MATKKKKSTRKPKKKSPRRRGPVSMSSDRVHQLQLQEVNVVIRDVRSGSAVAIHTYFFWTDASTAVLCGELRLGRRMTEAGR